MQVPRATPWVDRSARRVLNAMTKTQQRRLERIVGRPIPDSYVEFLSKYPQELRDVYPANRSAAERELFDSAEQTIAINQYLRRPEHRIDSEDPDSVWPKDFLVIGMGMGGNFYCLKLTLKRTPIYFWFHETNEFEKLTNSMEQCVNLLIKKHTSLRANDVARSLDQHERRQTSKRVSRKVAKAQRGNEEIG
jgi:hypothetical protein